MSADYGWQLKREAPDTPEEIVWKEKTLRATELLFPDLEIMAYNL
jgi:hypothetical protein